MSLDHFVTAQDPVYAKVVRELRQGRKTSHWMWFIFPQLQGLGFSEMTRRYSLDSVEAASAYLQHSVLGPRLLECTQLVLDIEGRSVEEIFGHPDDMKFRSCMTLFSLCPSAPGAFDEAIRKYFGGKKDGRTLQLLGMSQ